MLAICSMLLPPYYAQNYAGIIGSSLSTVEHTKCVANYRHEKSKVKSVVLVTNAHGPLTAANPAPVAKEQTYCYNNKLTIIIYVR